MRCAEGSLVLAFRDDGQHDRVRVDGERTRSGDTPEPAIAVTPRREARASARFLPLFALAWAGGCIAYVPFLTLLLPLRLARIAGGGEIGWLATITVAGGLSASAANILFGWASDQIGGRRPWVASGLLATLTLTAALAVAGSPASLLGAVVAWQVALNAMLAPLAAWAADAVPDHRRGLLGGVFGLGPAAGAATGLLFGWSRLASHEWRLAAVGALVLAAVLPLVLLAQESGPRDPAPLPRERASRTADLALVWAARLTVQVAQAALFGFLFYIFRALGGADMPEREFAALVTLVLLASVPLTFGAAAMAARGGRRRIMLVGACLAMAAGLGIMALSGTLRTAVAGYVIFGLASAVFLALQSGYAMLLLPTPGRHGRDLGLLNLSNTVPSVLSPLLALWLATADDFGPLLVTLVGLTLLAAALVGRVRWTAPTHLPRLREDGRR